LEHKLKTAVAANKQGNQVHMDVIRFGLISDIYVGNHQINCHSWCQKIECPKVFDELPKRSSVSTVIHACMENLLLCVNIIIVIEFSERASHFGISTSLITYLTNVTHKDLKIAVKNINYWPGTTTLMPLSEGFVAHAYTGQCPLVLFSSQIYLKGFMQVDQVSTHPKSKALQN